MVMVKARVRRYVWNRGENNGMEADGRKGSKYVKNKV